MNTSKRMLTLLLCGILLSGIMLTGCNNQTAPSQNSDPAQSQSEQSTEETENEEDKKEEEASASSLSSVKSEQADTDISSPQNTPVPSSAQETLAVQSAASVTQPFSVKKEDVAQIQIFRGGHSDYTAVYTITDAADQNQIITSINGLSNGVPQEKLNPVMGGLNDKIQITFKNGTVFSYSPHVTKNSMTLYLYSNNGENKQYLYNTNIDTLSKIIDSMMIKYPSVLPAFSLTAQDVEKINVYKEADSSYAAAKSGDISSIIKELNAVKWKGTGTANQAGQRTGYSMSLYTKNQVRHEYYLCENGLLLAGSPQDFGDVPSNVYYLADPQSMKALQNALTSCYRNNPHGVQWLGHMNTERIGQLVVKKGEKQRSTTECKDIDDISLRLKALVIKDDSTKQLTPDKSKQLLADFQYHITLTFDSSITYTIGVGKNQLVISSSDMAQSLLYELVDDSNYHKFLNTLERVLENAPAPKPSNANPATGKPVIYLYPEKEQQVRVAVNFKGNLTYTYPSMNNCWNVLAKPDGTLTNLEDGSTHYYLFWEGNSKTQWDFSEGFVVKGSDTQKFLTEALSTLGLTPKEYNDFLVYWVPEMQQNPYNLITFSTQQYEELAPLTVSPTPDTVIRVHMVYKPLDAPVEIPPQKLTAIPRKGFTLVEWGGSRADKNISVTQ